MNKLFLFTIAVTLFTTKYSLAQQGNAWGTSGNNGSNSDFIGTSNETDLIFKTNSIERMRLKADGNIKLSNPFNTRNILFQTPNGDVEKISLSGIEKQVLN